MSVFNWRTALGFLIAAAAGYGIDVLSGQFGVWVSLGAGLGAAIGAELHQFSQEQNLQAA